MVLFLYSLSYIIFVVRKSNFTLMQRNVIYILIILSVLLSGCEKPLSPILQKAEILMEKHPDSALKLLKEYHSSSFNDAANRALYALLRTQADDQNYIIHTSDTLILKAVDYYCENSTSKEAALAYYLSGRVYYDMQLTGDALNSFYKSLNVKCQENSTNCAIKAKAYNWIGQTYMYQDMFKEALPHFYRCLYFAKRANSNSIVVYALRDIARNYQSLGQRQKSIFYFNQAASFAKSTRQYYLYKVVMAEFAGVFIESKQFDKAKYALEESKGFTSSQNLAPYYMCLADFYFAKDVQDSAEYYYKKNLEISDMYGQEYAYNALSKIDKAINNYKEAYQYMNLSKRYADSISSSNLISNKNLIRSLDNKIQIERVNKQRIHYNDISIIILLLLLMLISYLVFILLIRDKKHKQILKIQRERIKIIQEELKRKSFKQKENNQNEIERLNNEIKLLHNEQNNTLKEKLLNIKIETLTNENKTIENAFQQQQVSLEIFKSTTLYHRLLLASNDKRIIKENEWDELEKYLNHSFNKFIDRLTELYPALSVKELRVCSLLKLDFNNADISRIILNTPSETSNIRKRLYKKLFEKEGKAEDFDAFIRSF